MSQRPKEYSGADLAFFARYANERAFAKPDWCTEGDQCWVKRGPPCLSSDGVCAECRTVPKLLAIYGRVRHRRFLKQRKLRR